MVVSFLCYCSLDVAGAEHKARVREYDYQQMFAVTSCISAKNLGLSKAFSGQDSKQVSGDQTYDKLKTGVGKKLEALKAIDAQIKRVSQLSKLFAHRENVDGGAATVTGGLGNVDDKLYGMVADQLAKNTGIV